MKHGNSRTICFSVYRFEVFGIHNVSVPESQLFSCDISYEERISLLHYPSIVNAGQ